MRHALASLALATAALAATPADVDLKERQLELLRAEVASEVQLQAAGLLDELVYGWTQEPPFSADTPVVLTGVTVPVSLGTGLEAYLENHLASLVTKNPKSRVQLVHCPACSAWVVRSGPTGTVVTRGFDDPQTLAQGGLSTGGRHALFLEFEAEGASLVLRARLTTLDASLRIVWARTLTTSTATPSLLRSGERLVSAQEARREYLEALGGRGLFLVPVRFGVRAYATGTTSSFANTPFFWLSAGLEAAFSQARAWTASVNAGFSWLPQSHVAVMAQGRVARLLSGRSTSLTWPDLYGFIGAGVLFGQGRGLLPFRNRVPTIDDVVSTTTSNEPRATLGLLSVGLELRVKNRVGLVVFLETLPAVEITDNIGTYVDLLVRFQSFGVEVSFCF
ncbi:MAG: hypothetical protein INH41_14205 [Myxococcaceae bacterium]|jgi:hypothetical protein|nr:hypothetical protein [Myxococcaceae bacterium]MCA3013531.1 hypothetical protein [Myxococcaceae bacterium]